MTARTRFTVVFTPAPGVIDGVKRLRHLLKVAGRRFGLIAVHVEETSTPARTDEHEGPSP